MGPKWSIAPRPTPKIFFWYKPLLLLSPTYWPFSMCKILKKSYSGSRVMIHHFWAQNGPSPFKFFLENYWYHSHLPISPFILQNFKNILPADPELWCTIFGPKMAHFPKWKFFQRTYYWALFLSFMPIYMPKIKVRYLSISEILTIKEYWNLIWL